MLLARHQIKAKEVHEHNGHLRFALNLRNHAEKFLFSFLRRFAPLLEYPSFVATLEMALC